jgi:hypothetical protein
MQNSQCFAVGSDDEIMTATDCLSYSFIIFVLRVYLLLLISSGKFWQMSCVLLAAYVIC